MEQSVELPVPQMLEQLVDEPKIVVELTVFSGEAGSSGPRERNTTDAAATAVEVPVGEARPLGIAQYSTATESEVEMSSGGAGSSWPGADDTTPVGAAPMDIAPGQIPAPGLGSSNQSTTSSSHGGSDSYPDRNNYEHEAQWGQDWNTGDADTSGSSEGELYGLQKGKGAKGEGGSFNGICYNCGKDSKGWKAGKGWSDGKGWNTSGKGWEQQRRAGMNYLERDSRQYDAVTGVFPSNTLPNSTA